MGLDWIAEDKAVEGKEADRARALEDLEQVAEELGVSYRKFLRSRGAEPPGFWPNPLSREWAQTEEAHVLFKKKRDLEASLGKLLGIEDHLIEGRGDES